LAICPNYCKKNRIAIEETAGYFIIIKLMNFDPEGAAA